MYVGRRCSINLKTAVGKIAAPALAKGPMYEKLKKDGGGNTVDGVIVETGTSTWKIKLNNGVVLHIPKNYYDEKPSGLLLL